MSFKLATSKNKFVNLENYPIQRSEIEIPVPAKAMFKSFILPGWGQVQNEDALWKPWPLPLRWKS